MALFGKTRKQQIYKKNFAKIVEHYYLSPKKITMIDNGQLVLRKTKVSVIVPIYGVEKYLRQCLDSVLNQSLYEIEILLIDDGGTDDCPAIIDEYAARDERVISVHKPNGGYGSACNVGLTYACGEYVAILEPDDFIQSDMYKTLYEAAEKNGVDIVKSPFLTYYDINGKKPFVKENNWFSAAVNTIWKLPAGSFTINEHPEFFYFHPSIWSCLYRRDFLNTNNIRFEEISGAGWSDNLFQIQTLFLARSIVYVNRAFYYWRLLYHDDALALKDITIPFKRTATIHEWMRANDVLNENIWACLYKRELGYLQIVLQASGFKNPHRLMPLFRNMLSDMRSGIITGNEYISFYDRRQYYLLSRYFYLYSLYCSIKYTFSQIRKVIKEKRNVSLW